MRKPTLIALQCQACGDATRVDVTDTAVLTGPAQGKHGTIRAVCATCESFIYKDIPNPSETLMLIGLGSRSVIITPMVDTLPGADPMTTAETAGHVYDIWTADTAALWAALERTEP